MEKTVRLTTAQAIVRFLDNQYVSMDGEETKFVNDFFTIFGHGIAVGLGEALDRNPGSIRVMQGRNEQGMCHCAIAYAKQNKLAYALLQNKAGKYRQRKCQFEDFHIILLISARGRCP